MSELDWDMPDFYDAWRASLGDRTPTTSETFEAGWQSAMRAVKAYREHELRIVDEERRQEAVWNRFQPQYP